MANDQIAQEGNFRGLIIEYGLFKSDSSKSVGVNITAHIAEAWDAEAKQWVDWTEYNLEAKGTIWVVGKEGTANRKAVESLMRYAGWDGDLIKIQNNEWEPAGIQFRVKKERYNDEDQYKIAFVNAWDSTPSSGSNVSAEMAKELQNRFGAQFRAMGGNASRATGAPAGKPKSAPPASKPKPKSDQPDGPSSDGVPF